jgi:hypothetical protein
LMFSLCTMCLHLYSQNRISCTPLEEFLNFPKVMSGLQLDNKSDTIVLIDLGNDFAGNCFMLRWKNKVAILKHDPALTKEIRGMDPYKKYKDACSFYIISEYSRKGRMHSFEILRPCNNIQVVGKITIVKGKTKQTEAKWYVL